MRCPTLAELPPPPPGKTGWPWTEESEQLPDRMPALSETAGADDRPPTTDDTPSSIVHRPSSASWPRISIVTPSYNQRQFIEETIRSVLLQGYPNLEYIVIDGGSDDGSVEIIKKYEPWLAYWASEPDRGQGHAINKGLEQASGDIVFWLNADDLVLRDAFQVVSKEFAHNPGIYIVTGQAHVIDAQGEIIGGFKSEFTSWEDLVTTPYNMIRQVATFFRRSLFEELGDVDEALYIAVDTELLIRFTQHYPPLILDTYLSAFRRHGEAKTQSGTVRIYEEADEVRKRYLSDDLIKVYRKRCARRWLNLFKRRDLPTTEKIICLKKAVMEDPSLILIVLKNKISS